MYSLFRGSRRDDAAGTDTKDAQAQVERYATELGDLKSQWHALLQAISDPVFSVERSGACRPLNVSAERMFPYAEHQTILSMTQSAELDALYHEACNAENPHPVNGEITLRYPVERVILASIYPVEGQQHHSLAYYLILRDLTELRRLEMVRRDFVANVSHELRTPLSSIKAMAETLIDGALNDPEVAEDFLLTIIRESDRLVRISADLLDLSRVESRPVIKSEVDLAELVLDLVSRMSPNAREAGISLTIDITPPLMAMCDGDEIAQVLVNLLDNAIKYTPRGGYVCVAARQEPDALVFTIEDTGIGILQQDIPRLFERFYRADKARSRASGGTGLGLSIVKHIVERHGGKVWVESEYNCGSTFHFSIPR